MAAIARRYINMWTFLKLHPSNIELLQRLKAADDRQFGAHMDICGEVSEQDPDTRDWTDTHVVGLRTDIWNPDRRELEQTINALHRHRRGQHRQLVRKKGRLTERQLEQLEQRLGDDDLMSLAADDIEKRRLVMKLFRTTGSRIRWSGSLEEVTTREVHNSLGSRRAVLSLVGILPNYEYLTSIEQNHRTFRIPAIHTLCFYDRVNSRTWYVSIKRKWFSFGADFLIESEGRPIGEIDGQLIGFGFNAYVTITEPELTDNRDFLDLMTLFAASVGYHRAMRKSLRRRVEAALSGETYRHVVEDEELWLLRNPRRRAA